MRPGAPSRSLRPPRRPREDRGHGVLPEPQPTVTYPPFHSRRVDQDTWVFTVSSGDPAKVAVKALAADGTVLAEQEHDLVWTMVGGTAQCGGPVTTPPIQLLVP